MRSIEAKAKSTVAAAFAGGIILVNADNAIVRHDGNYPNLTAGVLNQRKLPTFTWQSHLSMP